MSKAVGRPKKDNPLQGRTLKLDIEQLNKAIEIHGKKVVHNKIRELIKRLANYKNKQ